jgi:hypothetical protein
MFKKFESRETDLLKDFFDNSNVSEKHRIDSFDKILEYLETDEDYICYINLDNGMILSSVFMRDLREQKCRVLDFISSRKNISVYRNKVGELVDYGIKEGEERGFYRFYTVLTEEMKETVDVLMKKNLVFPWRKRYDTYVDEIIDPNNFTNYSLHWIYLLNTTVRDHRKVIRHHHLKEEFRPI